MQYGIYELVFFFFIYSFIGWLYDIVGHYVGHKEIVNRGFLIGPYCPIYGVGVIIMLLLINPNDSIVTIFVNTTLIATALEYISGFLMEKIFKARWWDYSDKKYNINGRISLETSIYFGLFSTFVIKSFQPLIKALVSFIPRNIGNIILPIIIITFVIDIVITIISVTDLEIKVKKLSEHFEDLIDEQKNQLVKDYKSNKKLVQKRLIKAFPNLNLLNNNDAFKKLKNGIRKK